MDILLNFQNKKILKDAGKISNKEMEERIDVIYAEFDRRRCLFAAQESDKFDDDELKQIENKITNIKQ